MSRTAAVYTASVPQWLERAQAFAAERQGDPAWLRELRARSVAAFAELGFPSTRQEEWRYTNTAAIAKRDFEHSKATIECAELPAGLRLESLAELVHADEGRARSLLEASLETKDRAFPLLAAAFLEDGALVTVDQNADLDRPLHLRIGAHSQAGDRALHPRLAIVAEPGSRATLLVEHTTASGDRGAIFTNAVTEVVVEANASLDLVILQRAEPGSGAGTGGGGYFQVSTTACRVERDARLRCHSLTLGGDLVRHDLDVLLAGEGAECDLRGLFVAGASQLVDHHTLVDHAMPHTNSRELYKGILGAGARGVFRGRVIVRPQAQKIDASQSNPNLLLGEGAEIDTKPQLEIRADDVKCSHGATIGQLDEEALFYLRSRGIGAPEARAVLTGAFANEIVDAVPDAALAETLRAHAARALEAASAPGAPVE